MRPAVAIPSLATPTSSASNFTCRRRQLVCRGAAPASARDYSPSSRRESDWNAAPRERRGRGTQGRGRSNYDGDGGGRGRGRGGNGGGRNSSSGRGRPRPPPFDPLLSRPPPPPPRAWRLFNLSVPVDLDPGKDDCSTVCEALASAAAEKLGCGRGPTGREGSGGQGEAAPRPLLPASAITIVRKSFDARSGAGGGVAATGGGSLNFSRFRRPPRSFGPAFVYVVDVDSGAAGEAGARSRQREVPGKLERVEGGEGGDGGVAAATATFVARAASTELPSPSPPVLPSPPSPGREKEERTTGVELGGGIGGSGGGGGTKEPDPIVIVGGGPAGLFAALALATSVTSSPSSRFPRVVLLERGAPVESRGRSIGALFARRVLDPESNLCFGEGGAGTWSDGKLTTRIGRNDGDVRAVLATLVAAGAPPSILVSGKPHLGTDRLVRVLRTLRGALMSAGVDVRFGCAVDGLVVDDGSLISSSTPSSSSSPSSSESRKGVAVRGVRLRDGSVLKASAVVVAPGHSARDTYRSLIVDAGVAAEAKPFALGFRVEHPQEFVDSAQYGELASQVLRGKGKVPVADYRLATEVEVREERNELKMGKHGIVETEPRAAAAAVSEEATLDSGPDKRGVYSFCMCPGGQVVPTSTDETELCVNGMSFSARGSRWANAALVVAVGPGDWRDLEGEHGALAGVEMQRRAERVAARLGGGGLVAPAMRVDDYLSERKSPRSAGELPPSSYRLGVAPADLRDGDLYSEPIHRALSEALKRFDRQVPGFATAASSRALLHGVETRTSAPVRLTRDGDASATPLESTSVRGLFPAGEGAGYAGGIVSAAVDGLRVGEAVRAAVAAGAVAG